MSFYTHDNVIDSPLNNFATFSPLAYRKGQSHVNLSNGNLRIKMPTSSIGFTSFIMSSGKWYWEVYIENNGTVVNHDYRGILAPIIAQSSSWNINPSFIYNSYNGSYRINGGSWTSSNIGAANNPSVIGFFWNADDGEMTVSVNGVAGTTITGITTGIPMCPFSACDYNTVDVFNFGQDYTFGGADTGGGGYQDANGIGQFYYQPPAGALALCTKNIPSGPINIANDDVPADYIKAVTYTGNGSGQSIDVGFQPDLVWIKDRDRTGTYHQIYDSLRGSAKVIFSNDTLQEYNRPDGLTSFNSNGFSVGTHSHNNHSGYKFVSWVWKAAGAPADGQAKIINEDGFDGTMSTADLVTNTGASITPAKVSANRKSGFSIVRYTGNQTAGTKLPHGLNQKPDFMIAKGTGVVTSWSVYHSALGASKWLTLNSPNASSNNNQEWNGQEPTEQYLYLGASNANNNQSALSILYLWHSVAGYSKFGSYVGNGSTDGPFVECGFRPAWVMVKRTNASDHWFIIDVARSEFNVMGDLLLANSFGAEFVSNHFDFTSNGFKLRNNGAGINGINGTFIFMAFAESPFNAPATAR